MARSCILQIAVKWGCAFVGMNSYQRLRTQAKRSPGKQQSRDLILFSFYLHALTVLETENANIYMRGKVKAVPSFLDQHIRSEGVCPTVFAVGLDPPRYWAKQRRDWRSSKFSKMRLLSPASAPPHVSSRSCLVLGAGHTSVAASRSADCMEIQSWAAEIAVGGRWWERSCWLQDLS